MDALKIALLADLRTQTLSHILIIPGINIGTARKFRAVLVQALRKTSTATPTWIASVRECLRHNSLSSKEYAVMVSGPPRCSRKNGAQNAVITNFGSILLSPILSALLESTLG